MPWNVEFECMPRDQRRSFQTQVLRETVAWVVDRVPFYRRRMAECGITVEKTDSYEAWTKLPFTTKDDLQLNYPFGLCAVPMRDVVRVHASSGTTGKPITGPYTVEDLKQWAECMARTLWAAGVRPEDILQDAHGYGLFTGGLGFLQGATLIGCAMIPTGAGMTERQIVVMQDFGTTVLCCTPSYALTIAERAAELGVNLESLHLRLGVFGGEPWTAAMRQQIESRLGIKAMEAYGLTELGGPGVAFACETQDGLHINEDYFLAEIVDPATLEPLPVGERGELVLTSLRRQAMPMIRFRTKDMTRLREEPCPCGRTFRRIDKIMGRSDDMLSINGVNVYPSQIESLLLDIGEVEPQYVLVVKKKGYLDQLIVKVEAKDGVFRAGPEKRNEVEKKVSAHIRGMVGISALVDILEPKTLARSQGKARRVTDERPQNS